MLNGARTKRTTPRVLMIGTALDGRGGVAAVVDALRSAGLFERESVHYLSSHREGPASAKAGAAIRAVWLTSLACLRTRPARPAVVHVHCASRASFARKSLLLSIARLAGCRTVFHLHGGEFGQFASAESGAALRWWIRRTLERSSAVVALSDSWAAFVRGYAPAARVVVVPNPVAVPAAATPLADGPGERAEEQPARILFLGRAEVGKGVFELVAAVASLAAAFPAIRLVIGGSGDLAQVRRYAAALEIGERLETPGWLDPRQKAIELARAQVFCLPSHAEGLPMAMLEAMAAGKAVVVTRVGAIPEAVEDRANGMLVPPRDVPALATALAALFSDDALRIRLGGQARATVAQRFSTEAALGKLAALYRELASR